MNGIFETWLGLCVIAVITGNSLAQMRQYTDDVVNDAAMSDVNKRGWNMLRLGRGLHMLRLGKRSASLEALKLGNQAPVLRASRSLSDSDSNNLSDSDVQAVLASIFDAPRDQSRRQPPLPRYGRDSSNNRRDLLDAVSSDEDGAFPLDFFPVSNTRLFFRPAPRGGRYKRSLPAGRFTYGDIVLQDAANQPRAVALPRIGRFFDQVSRVQPKAVPRPRIGREQDNQASDSDNSKNVSA